MGRKIFKSGNSAVVSIPPEVMEVLGLETGDEVNVIADLEQCQIAIRPTSKTLEYRAAEQKSGVSATALEKARCLREAFAAQYGVLDVDLVQAARAERTSQINDSLEWTESEAGDEPGR